MRVAAALSLIVRPFMGLISKYTPLLDLRLGILTIPAHMLLIVAEGRLGAALRCTRIFIVVDLGAEGHFWRYLQVRRQPQVTPNRAVTVFEHHP